MAITMFRSEALFSPHFILHFLSHRFSILKDHEEFKSFAGGTNPQ